MGLIDECYDRLRAMLLRNSTKLGVAAGKLYPQVWGRDGLIACLGMCSAGDKELIRLAELTITSLAKSQRANGQMPNFISPEGYVDYGNGGCVDASLWYPLAVLSHYLATQDDGFAKLHLPSIEGSLRWVLGLDQNADDLIEVNEGSDWMDCLIRGGRVLYDEVLLYAALRATDYLRNALGLGKRYDGLARRVREAINLLLWPLERNEELVKRRYGNVFDDFKVALQARRPHYLAELRWKYFDPRCDVYANVLAVLFDIASRERAKAICDFLQEAGVSKPYPVRVLHPPIHPNDMDRIMHFRTPLFPYLEEPGNYQNGGIWPYVGSFYALMLGKLSKPAVEALEGIAEANKLGIAQAWEFNEWLDWNGRVGMLSREGRVVHRSSPNQSWNATYLLAYRVIVKGCKPFYELMS